ncbi:MAG TPA: endonuclease MutS2 [Anaerolineaceae bacterium]|nr:endonuclease MutS2 [Anaerolineaceae bacterium]
MNPKSLILLEYHKVLTKLTAFASFSASAEQASVLRPTSNLEKALMLQNLTREARHMLNLVGDISFNGAVDLRPLTDRALHGVVLEAAELLNVRNTLILSRDARRVLLDHQQEAPALFSAAKGLSDGLGLVDLISRTINDHGEVLDSASEALTRIRSEQKVTHGRLMERLSRYLTDPRSSRMLQETLITQRGGRYVLPLRAEFKGQLKGLVHDQSASGATIFIEPITVVDWNNKYRELELAERDEIIRVLRSLSERVADNAQSLNATSEAMVELDLALAKARYAEDLRASEPELVPFDLRPPEHHPGSQIRLIRARHPLLDQSKTIPIDVELDPETFAVVLTGPNTGGKTVTLKTVGLMVLMAQSGLQIPARSGSRLSVFRDVFADIGDEQSIEQSLSTFSGHITQLVRILKRADYRSLVLLDELGSGTDPQEGSALARAVLNDLICRRVTCIVATHYPELKTYAHTTRGAINASLEFDLETLRPTYNLIIGLPGRSNALAIAERLGLKAEIIEAARQELDPTELDAEDLLDEIHRQRDLARQNFELADQARQEAEDARDKLNARIEQYEIEHERLLEKAQEQAQNELEVLKDELASLRREMARLKEPREKIVDLEERVEEIETKQEQTRRKKRVKSPRPKGEATPLRIGEKVLVRKLKTEGVVTDIEGETIEVQVGVLRLRLTSYEVERKRAAMDSIELPAEVKKAPAGKISLPAVASPGLELDLRGMRVEDALDKINDYLEQGYLSGIPFGRVIHGKGTGALRQAIRRVIKESSHVKRWEVGGEKDGGDGVSVVFFEEAK